LVTGLECVEARKPGNIWDRTPSSGIDSIHPKRTLMDEEEELIATWQIGRMRISGD
jgi:hypothetical protein